MVEFSSSQKTTSSIIFRESTLLDDSLIAQHLYQIAISLGATTEIIYSSNVAWGEVIPRYMPIAGLIAV